MNMHVRTKPSVPCNRWTDKDDVLIRKGLERGLSFLRIARDLGRSEDAVKSRCTRQGISRPDYISKARRSNAAHAKSEKSQIEKLKKHDASIAQIARMNPVKTDPVPFYELTKHQCRFVVDDSSGVSMNCCGAPVMGGKGDARKHTHCEHHYKASIGVR
ncbi:MAG: GcrA family cell cycle regulator [Lentilitoribacter sp.]